MVAASSFLVFAIIIQHSLAYYLKNVLHFNCKYGFADISICTKFD